MENDQRVSLRSRILREVISNLLIHREFTNPFPAKFVIEKDKFYTENSNKAHNPGIIDPTTFSPCPKNPAIARVFREIGRADELGSGVRNLFKYCKQFSNHDPHLVEGDVFKFVLSIHSAQTQVTDQVTDQVTEQDDRVAQLLHFCSQPKSASQMMEFLRLRHRRYFRSSVLSPLIEKGWLAMTIPEKPSSPSQKYQTTSLGKRQLESTKD